MGLFILYGNYYIKPNLYLKLNNNLIKHYNKGFIDCYNGL